MVPGMNAKQSLLVQAMHGVLVLCVVAAASVLAYADKLDGQTVAVLLGAAITFAGGSAQSLGTLGQAVNGKSTIATSTMDEREATLRTMAVAAAAAPAHTVTAVEPRDPEATEEIRHG